MRLSKETKRKILVAKFMLMIIMTISYGIMKLNHPQESSFLVLFGLGVFSFTIYTFCSFIGHIDADDNEDRKYYGRYGYLLNPKFNGQSGIK